MVLVLVASPHFSHRFDPDGPVGDIGWGTGSNSNKPPPPPPPSEDLKIKVTQPTASSPCYEVQVTNVSDAPIEWSVLIDVPGVVQQAWSCNYVVEGNQVRFSGLAWNATLAVGAQTKFGYCLKK